MGKAHIKMENPYMVAQIEMESENGSIDMVADAPDFAWRVDYAIMSETGSNFGSSPVHSFTSILDNAIRSETVSIWGTSPVLSFASAEDNAMRAIPGRAELEADAYNFLLDRNRGNSNTGGRGVAARLLGLANWGRRTSPGISKSSPSNLSIVSYTEASDVSSFPTPRSEGEILSSPNLKAFTFNELKNATRNFRPDSLLGEGRFGYVYKGWIDEHTFTASKPGSGMVVAVKKLKPEGLQGHKEWLTEVNYLGQLHHQNLVKLIGHCVEGEQQLLVYEFMPKGSLENHLFRRGPQPLSWSVRMKVAIGAARGLAFLHNDKSQVIYRDFKASNILLDADFNAKLSDFGLAKAGPTGDRTHVSTQVMGTQGYAAPEYVATGRLTAKSDVYSFGVVLLELLSGRRAIDRTKASVEQNLVEWTKLYLGDRRKLFRIMDTSLGGRYPKKGAYRAANLALRCLDREAKSRPPITEVLETLEKIAE